jgi:hypothetical protein
MKSLAHPEWPYTGTPQEWRVREVPPNDRTHYSSCAVHNEPAFPNGPCDCGGYDAKYLHGSNG